MDPLQSVEIETGRQPRAAVIWLHGLGADGHDFEPIVPALVRTGERALRFVFPHAPVRPVTLNGGLPMRAWYDIIDLDRQAPQDDAGIRASDEAVRALIRQENERGIPTDQIVLAGFSQGGALALYTGTRMGEKLGGIMALSCYMLRASSFSTERSAASRAVPIFMGHGAYDPVVDPSLGEETRRMLEETGYVVEWHTYPIPHSVSPEEVEDIAKWLRRVL